MLIVSFTNYVALGLLLMSLSLKCFISKKSPFSGNVSVTSRDNTSRMSAWHRGGVQSVKAIDVIIIVILNKQIPGQGA